MLGEDTAVWYDGGGDAVGKMDTNLAVNQQ